MRAMSAVKKKSKSRATPLRKPAARKARPVAPLAVAPKLEEIPVKPIYTLLDDAVKAVAAKPAMEFMGRKWTYAELGDLVEKAAAGFRALGVKRDVKVGLHLPNSPYYVICYFAILKAGGTVVNFNPLYVERELSYQIKDSGTEIMVTMDLAQTYSKLSPLLGQGPFRNIVLCKMAEALPTAKAALYTLFRRKDRVAPAASDRIVPFSQLIRMGAPFKPDAIDPKTAIAVLQYTGGTTGTPKGAVLTHANITANVAQLTHWVRMFDHKDGKMLCVLPFFHVFGMTVVMLVGIELHTELILLPRFEVNQVLKVIAKKRPTLFPGVPTIYIAVNRAIREYKGKLDVSSIKACISGGAPLPVEVKKEFESLTGCLLVEGYGLSEASPVVTCNPFDGVNKEGSIGIPMPGTAVEIHSTTEPRKILKQGEKGELWVRGPQVMQGYWQKPEDSADVLVDGALRTGDVAYVDEDGYIHVVDRIKDVIICSGFKIFPRMVEDVLYTHPAVAEAVVVGVPDEYRGQTPKAYIKLKPGSTLSEAEVKKFLGGQLARHELPQYIEFRDELPRTMIGKFSKKALQDEEKAKAPAQVSHKRESIRAGQDHEQ